MKPNQALSLIVDIQSNLIRGSIIDFSAPVESRILYSTAVPSTHKNHVSGSYITKMMLKSLENLAEHIVKQGLSIIQAPVKSVHFVLSSPWVLSQSQTISIAYDKDTTVTEDLVQNIIDDERVSLIKQYESDDMVFVEQKIFEVKLNGYSVENYKGKKAKSLQISFAFSLSSDQIIKRMHEAVLKVLHVRNEYYHSCLLLQYSALRSVIGSDEDYMVVHVHGELTDIVIVKKGLSSSLTSFPFGALTFVRKVALSLKTSVETSDSTISLYEGNKLDKIHTEKVEKSIINNIKGWHAELSKALAHDTTPPRKIYFSSEEGHSITFKKVLKDMQFDVLPETHSLTELYTLGIKGML